MRTQYKRKALTIMLTTAMISSATFAADDSVELTEIEVIGTTPMHGVGLSADQIASNIQSATSEDIDKIQGLDISDFMNKTLGSVSINSAQNNPFQPDLRYRGFTSSPLVGNSQGMSVFMDGVRVNEPFGDAVNFELIPESAIGSMNLMPGSNPLFGLNTLGGALSIQTKNGFTHEGHELEAYTGSFGRDSGSFSSGGNDGTFGYFVTGSITKEDGWRDFSPSRLEQFFSNLSYRNEDTTLDLGITVVDSDLNGNGAAPVELVNTDRKAVFTHPDNTQNELHMFTLNGSHWLNDNIMLSANTYYRSSDRTTFNGDGSELAVIGNQVGEDEDDDDVLDEISITNAAAYGFANGDFVALNNTSDTEQDSYGFGLQSTFLKNLFGKENQLIVGATYDRSDVKHSSQSEIARFTATRGTSGTGVLVDETIVDGNVDTETYSLFFTDTISLTDKLALTLGGRYNRIEIDISGTSKGGTKNLNETGEKHVFKRFNPSVGLTYAIEDNLNVYGSYSESNRAPTPSELTCAEPTSPCAYPNAFLADPPLDDVVAKTVEAGLRGQQANFNWNAGVYYTELKDDLFFFPEDEDVSVSPDPRFTLGNFANIDKTARAGIELGLSGQQDKLQWFANYGYVRATFEDSFAYVRAGKTFNVNEGDRLPSTPEHNVKVGTDYALTDKFSLGATASYHSSQYFRGDEANDDKKISGYGVVNLHSRYNVNKNIQFFAKVDNLFDNEYESFGLYGEPDEAPGLDALTNSRFVGAGAPRAGWVGIKVSM
ncbi:MAG: TonB-dependent receptor [Gammaproteobacteria bacterium]|nr:TonB-dependent receptor [Gammaproteobacteria bacterium]